MKTVLVTAIGGDIAQGVAAVLREQTGKWRIIGTDVHPEHGGSVFADRCVVVPAAAEPAYKDALLKVVAAAGVDVVMPMSEPELAAWAGDAGRAGASADWVMLSDDIIRTGLDKLATNRRLEALGLPVPWTQSVADGAPPELPCILKERAGSGSKGVFRIGSEQDVAYLSARHPQGVFQELLQPGDREVTCAVYRTRDGCETTIQLKRRLAGGLTGYAEVIREPSIDAMCRAVARGLDLHGSLNIQLMLTEKGPRIFEINPRFSSTALMRHRLGFSDVLWSLAELEGRTVEFPAAYAGRVVARTHGAAIVS